MKVMLIIPSYTMGIYSDKMRELNWEYHSLGLAYIGSVAESLGHEVKVLDCEVLQLNMDQTREEIRNFKPELIGMQVFYFTSDACYEIADMAKSINPEIKVVLGGLHPTVFPDEAIEKPGVDFVVREEGEIVFQNLVNTLNNGNHFEKVDGLIWKKDGEVMKNEPEKQIEDLDTIDYPALHLFPMDLYHSSAMMHGQKTLHMVTSRGCHAKCSFCIVPFGYKGTFRSHSPQRVIDEMKYFMNKYDMDSFQFLDDSFTYERDRVMEICRLLIKEGMTSPWTCFARADEVDLELLQLMREAGCYQIHFGIETLIPRLVKILNKQLDFDHVAKAFENTKKAGIEGMASMMSAIPTETVEEALQSVALLNKTEADHAIYHKYNPWPGVPLYNFAMENGRYTWQDRKMFLLKWTPVVYVPNGRTPDEIIATEKKCLRKFYFRPKQLVKTANNLRKLPVGKAYKLVKGSIDTFF